MDKGYYQWTNGICMDPITKSQSTIKMDKGYYGRARRRGANGDTVAIHNKNGQGLLPTTEQAIIPNYIDSRNPQ